MQINEKTMSSLVSFIANAKDKKEDAVALFNRWVDEEQIHFCSAEEVAWVLNFISCFERLDNGIIREALKIDKQNKNFKERRLLA